ncbi:MAG: DUF2061 domain-containing protein [Dehalococcoidia bacterium]
MMSEATGTDLKRRSVVKALIWRFIGIIWTWVGAYLILVFVPDKYASAAMIATLIVIYHHSTRMVMYYFYERLWVSIGWGKVPGNREAVPSMSGRSRIMWVSATVSAIAIIFTLILVVSPLVTR